MTNEEVEKVRSRLKELHQKLSAQNARDGKDACSTQSLRLQGNIGALEWVLREFMTSAQRYAQ